MHFWRSFRFSGYSKPRLGREFRANVEAVKIYKVREGRLESWRQLAGLNSAANLPRGFSAARDENLHTSSVRGWRAIAKWRVTRASKTISRRLALRCLVLSTPLVSRFFLFPFILPFLLFDLHSPCTGNFCFSRSLVPGGSVTACARWEISYLKKERGEEWFPFYILDTNEREGNGTLPGYCFTYQILLQKAPCFGYFMYLCKPFAQTNASKY